jgi:hypothetical protein
MEKNLKAPRAKGFLLANAPKTAFIRISPGGLLSQLFHSMIYYPPIADAYRNCQ